MGTRLHKIIGYGSLELPENVFGSYNGYRTEKTLAGFYSWLGQFYPEEADTQWFLPSMIDGSTKEGKTAPRDLIKTFETKDEDTDDFQMWNGKNAVVFVPPVISDEAHQFDDSFLYAELEFLSPESLTKVKNFGFGFLNPPFPTEYTVINKETAEEAPHGWETYRYLRARQRGETPDELHQKIALMKTGYETIQEMEKHLTLAPPTIIKRLAEYFDVFSDPATWLILKPVVIYYWT